MAQTLEQAFLNAGFPPVKPRKARPPKAIKCRKCGAPMEIIENTNVAICTGEFDIDENGQKKSVSCNHRIIFSDK